MPGIPAECQGISSQLRPMTPPSTWDKEMILALSTEADAWICLEGVQKWPWKWPWLNDVDVEMIQGSKNLQDDGMNPTAYEMGSFL